jgi:response regulator RpfG family c-di-GMP phosphodiesterase
MRFINISADMLMPETYLNTNIFLYEEQSHNRIVAFYAGYAIEENHYEEVLEKVNRGGILQINYDDRVRFCSDTDAQIEEVEQLNEFMFEMIEKEQYYKEKYMQLASQPLLLKTFFQNYTDFKPLLQNVKAQVLCFPLTLSDEVSLTIQIVEDVLDRDNSITRCAALAYSLAKLNKVDDPEILSSILLASLYKDIGLTQVIRSSVLADNSLQDQMYFKHPILSIYVLSKSGVEFSTLTKRLILEHHEKENGEGFPREKKENAIHHLSYFIQVAHTIVNLVAGRYTSQEMEWDKAFDIIIHERTIDNLDTQFPYMIKELIKTLKS